MIVSTRWCSGPHEPNSTRGRSVVKRWWCFENLMKVVCCFIRPLFQKERKKLAFRMCCAVFIFFCSSRSLCFTGSRTRGMKDCRTLSLGTSTSGWTPSRSLRWALLHDNTSSKLWRCPPVTVQCTPNLKALKILVMQTHLCFSVTNKQPHHSDFVFVVFFLLFFLFFNRLIYLCCPLSP